MSASPANLLAPYVGRRNHRTVVLVRLELAQVTVDPAARRVQDLSSPGPAHRLDHILCQQRSLIEVDHGIRRRGGDVRIRRKVNHRSAAIHCFSERIDVAHVVTYHRKTRVAGVRSDVPLAPG